jgi:ABC-type amino acid transport substrate-binding protein
LKASACRRRLAQAATAGFGKERRITPRSAARAGVVAVLVAVALTACGGSDGDASGDPTTDKLAQVQARGTLVGFFEPDYAPQSVAAEGGTRPVDTKCADNQLTGAEVTGYDTEVTKLVAEELGVEPCFVSPPWTEVTSGNWSDRWDIAFGSGAITADRMERLYMTQPYYATANRYFVKRDAPYQQPSDLDGKKIGACVSCSQEAYLKGDLVIPGVEIVVDVTSPETVVFEVEGPGLEAVAEGTIDAFLAADQVGRAEIEEGAPLRALESVAFSEYASGFVDKSSGLSSAAFVERVDEIVRTFLEDGTLARLSQTWFKTDYTQAAAEFDIEGLEQVVQ